MVVTNVVFWSDQFSTDRLGVAALERGKNEVLDFQVPNPNLECDCIHKLGFRRVK
jgi:hypothetical protein